MIKIIQLLKLENDSTWQGRLLGLGNNGITYELNKNGKWQKFIPALEDTIKNR